MDLSPEDTKLSDDERLIVQTVLQPIMEALAALNDRHLVSAGDVTRVLSFALAAVLEADDKLVTPRDMRQASEYVGKLIAYHLRTLRDVNDATGASFMAGIVSQTIDER